MKKRGFSLMEMMIVLLIVAIVIAASAPMINKKLVRSAASDSSPWVWTSALSNSIAYNLGGNDNASASIGTITPGAPGRLFIHTKGNIPQIAFGHGDYASMKLQVTGDSVSLTDKDTNNGGNFTVAMGYGAKADSTGSIAVGYKADAIGGENAVAIGREVGATGLNSIAIGTVATADEEKGIAIGQGTTAKIQGIAIGSGTDTSNTGADANAIAIGLGAIASYDSISIGSNAGRRVQYPNVDNSHIAIGSHAKSSGNNSIAIGSFAKANANDDRLSDGIAIGSSATVTEHQGIAIGARAEAKHLNSIAIGNSADTTAENQIVLGNASTTVYIPGQLHVDGDGYFAKTTGKRVYVRLGRRGGGADETKNFGALLYKGGDIGIEQVIMDMSDRRLKNVGEAFASGLEAVKKLEVFNYTFKNDKSKTPRVGVMAQDLQKIFPNAVMKGEDGFLRIRMEDMFYAVINAVKELDSMIRSNSSEITELKKQVAELEKQNKKLEERLEKLEKRK